jgi:hypothetical protein
MLDHSAFGLLVASIIRDGNAMLKVTIEETKNRRRLILEGALVQPWLEEFKKACAAAGKEPSQLRRFVVDLHNVTAISKEGEEVLSDLMRRGAKFDSAGVLTKYLLKRLALKQRAKADGGLQQDSSND